MSDTERPRDRSASPAREPRPKKPKTGGGFKWKEKRPRDTDSVAAAAAPRDSDRLHRGYRDRSPRRDSHRDRDDDRPGRRRDEEPTKKGTDSDRPTHTRDDARTGDPSDRPAASARDKPDKPKKAKKEKKAVAAPSGPMIVVNVNDRLGTKAAIPCLASDSIKAFKAIVAAHIGRQPHEIMLKRQGERPFKDQLTLEDYGVSSGVQLDLEIDTGD